MLAVHLHGAGVDTVEHQKPGLSPPFLQGSPIQLGYHCSDITMLAVVAHAIPRRIPLYNLDHVGVPAGIGVPCH